MGVLNPNSTGYVHPNEPNLLSLHKAMVYRDGEPHLRVDLGSDNITVTGNINVLDNIRINNTLTNPVPVFLTQTATVFVNNFTSTVFASNFTSTVRISSMPAITGTVTVSNFTSTVRVSSMPAITGTVAISSLPAITGTVTATIANIITVITGSEPGEVYAFNNASINANRGWTMDDTMRPMVSFRVNTTGTTVADLVKIVEYEIGNNNANQSTIVYEWYEGNLTISDAAIPSWTTLGTKIQYRVYQDKYSGNTGNTFSTNGAKLRHSGIIIGKNTQGDEGPATLIGGNSPNMLTLCLRRVDNATKLDVWFAFTIKELT